MSVLLRESDRWLKHLTVTGYTVTPDRTHLLMVFHKKLRRWLPPGGHVEENEFPSDAVLREVREETGIRAVHVPNQALDLDLDGVVDVQLPTPLTMSAQLIPKNGRDREHIHIDMMFELVANNADRQLANEREVAEIRWFSRHEVLQEPETFDAVRTYARERLADVG